MQCDHCKSFLSKRQKPLKGYRGSYCSQFCRSDAESLAADRLRDTTKDTAQLLAYDMYCLATHKDCPQWVRDSAEAIFNDLTR